MTIQVRVVNCANWDEDVLLEREGYGIHGVQVLKRGEVSDPISVEHGKPPTVLHLKPGSTHPTKHPKTGSPYLGEVEVVTQERSE